MSLGMFLFNEIPDAAPDGAGKVSRGGRLRSHGLRRGLKDGARQPTGLIWFNSQIHCLRHEHGYFT